MTASSTPDLVSRVLAAIDSVEQLAQLAVNSLHPHAWAADLLDHPAGQYTAHVDAALNIKITVETNPLSCDAGDLARFIAHNDPASVLRRCAADRRILEVHRQVPADAAGREKDEPTGCQTCDNDIDCGWTLGNGICDTVLLLAEGYGITPEEN